MNYELAFAALLVQVFLAVYQVKIWKLRVVLSPGFYFAVIWAFGLVGCLILGPLGLLFSPYPEYIDELNILVGFTSLCFIFFTKRGTEHIDGTATLNIKFCTDNSFKFLCVLFLMGALADFIRLGASFNVGGARENLVKILEGRPTWIGYVQLLSLPLSVYAGSRIIRLLQGEFCSFLFRFFLVIPLVANLIFSMNVGGRVDLVYAVTQYFIGFALGIPLNQSLRQYIHFLRPLILVAISLVVFISVVGKLRSNHHQNVSDSRMLFEQKGAIAGALYGPVEYILATYSGYQLRRVDAVDENNLGYGRYTFNGFINWTLPFASQYGLGDFSIAKYFDIYYYNQETYDYKRELFYTTHSGYIPIIKDFGFRGSFLCILFLTFLSHTLFVELQKKRILVNACQLFFFFLFWNYWVKMNFYGTLSSSIMIPLYSFFIVDVVRKICNNNFNS